MRIFFIYTTLLICLGLFVLGCGSDGNSDSANASYPAKTLPDKFIASMIMTSGSSTPSKKERIEFVGERAELARMRGLQALNLVVDWRDIEPAQGVFDFDTLDKMIMEVKSRDLFLILRIYVNTSWNWQAWPDWVGPVNTYVSSDPNGGKASTNILPWDPIYQAAFEASMQKLYEHFMETNVQPDAVQVTIGGLYGEQVLSDYAYTSDGFNDTTFFDALMDAEYAHVDIYLRTLAQVVKDHIVMVNSLWAADPDREDQVGVYARHAGVSWIQSNAGACFMDSKSYGPDNMKMLGRFKAGGAKIFLEDESGYWSCPEVGKPSSLTNRVQLMEELQSTYGFSFDAVSIHGVEDLDDTAGISALKNMLGI